MPRKGGSKSEGAIGLVAIVMAIGFVLYKIILAFLPFIIALVLLHFYYKWHKSKLLEYDNDFSSFYNYELKPKLKIGLIVSPFLVIGGLSLAHKADKNEKIRIEKEFVENEKQRIREEEIARKKQESLMKSNEFLNRAQANFDKNYYKSTLKYCDSALVFQHDNIDALELIGKSLYKSRKYEDAILFYNNKLGVLDKGSAYYTIAKSYSKLGNSEEAILNAHKSSDFNNDEGIKLYDKLNPIQSIITGYYQRCCDGSKSYSTGKGTCSSHGGICKRNIPIYSKRRKYKITSR